MKAEASFILNKAAINKIDGTEARHYSELAEEAARNAEADAERAEEVAREMESLDGRLDALEETVGDSSAGLVKDVADAQGDITALETVKNNPQYFTSDEKLQLYDILNGNLPISFDTDKFIEITNGSYETSYPIVITATLRSGASYYQSGRPSYIKMNDASTNNGSRYYISLISGSTVPVIIEYRPTGAPFKLLNGTADAAKPVVYPLCENYGWKSWDNYQPSISSYTDYENFRVVRVNLNAKLFVWYSSTSPMTGSLNYVSSFENFKGVNSDGSLTANKTVLFTEGEEYSADAALEALDFSAAIPQKDMKEFYVADTIYKPVDTAARSDISTLQTTVGDSNSGLVKDVADAQGDITALETTVGDSTSGLVKDVSDLTDLAADMMNDISGLEAVKNDPIYSTADNKLQLYDILNGDIPISFDDTEFIEITPGAYETTYPFRIDSYYTNLSSWSYAYATIKNASATSKYYIGYMGASPYNKPNWPNYIWNQGAGEFVVIEYNPNGEFSFNEISLGDAAAGLNLGWIEKGQYISYAYLSIISMSNTDSGNFRIVHVRIECVGMNDISAGDYGVRGIRKYASDGSVENAYWPTVISYTDYTASDALEALDFSAAIPQKDMKEFYVADTIYKPVDTAARSDISTLQTTVGDSNSGLVKDVADAQGDITALETTVGDANSGLVHDVTALQAEVVTEVAVSGTDPVITATANTRYICGEVTTVSFTPSATGVCEVIFTSGSLATVLTLPATVKMPEWFVVETNHTYEISILNGVYGGVMSWPTA